MSCSKDLTIVAGVILEAPGERGKAGARAEKNIKGDDGINQLWEGAGGAATEEEFLFAPVCLNGVLRRKTMEAAASNWMS